MRYKKSVFRSLAMVTQLGLYMVTPILLCVLAGYIIDSRFGTKSILFWILIGFVSGISLSVRMILHTLRTEERERENEKAEKKRQSKACNHEVSRPKQSSRIFGRERNE